MAIAQKLVVNDFVVVNRNLQIFTLYFTKLAIAFVARKIAKQNTS